MFPFLGPLISGGLGLLSGLLGSSATKAANSAAARSAAAANRMQMQMANRNIALQKQFATHGIQWKVADAGKAGVSPLYALGASTNSFQPVSVGSSTVSPQVDNSLAAALPGVGQDISRAVSAVQSTSERAYTDKVRALDLQRMSLNNQLTASQIARERQLSMPTVPNPYDMNNVWAPNIPMGKSSPTQPLQAFGMRWLTSPRTSNAQDVEQRYGDEGPVAMLAGVPALLDDLYQNSILGRYVHGNPPFNH